MSKREPKLAAKITSTFAIVEIKLGRHTIRKAVESGYTIPFTLQGTIDPGKAGIGPSDNVGTEFSVSVDTITIRKPILQPCDKFGRRYALAKNMQPGVILESDGGFTCMREGSKHVVKRRAGRMKGVSAEYAKDPFARLYVSCKCGGHTLDGQLGGNGELVGFYQVRAA
jgi:hypothetical protein